MQELMINGFLIFPANGKFIMRKEAVPDNPVIIPEQEYETYELAVDAANRLLEAKHQKWDVIVRYNQGLGIEYKNLPVVLAKDKSQALQLAEIMAEAAFDRTVEILQVKVKLKMFV